MSLIPIEQIADDQRASVEAFRAAGGRSFQDAASVEEARANYVRSSGAAGFARIEVARVEDVTIGDGETQFGARVYDPRPVARRSSASPVVLFFHAGGWVVGNLDTHDTLCRRFADRLQLPVVAVDYRLGPEHRFPAAHDDAVHAVQWVRDEAVARGFDASRLITAGDSAGGGLATMLASQPAAAVDGTRIVAQVLLYPVLDLACDSRSYERVDASAGVSLTAATMRWFAEQYLADPAEASDERCSPLRFAARVADEDAGAAATPQAPAFILSLGLDPLCDEIIAYAGLLARTGTEVEHLHLPRHAHGIFTTAGKVAAGGKLVARACAFIEQRLDALDQVAPRR